MDPTEHELYFTCYVSEQNTAQPKDHNRMTVFSNVCLQKPSFPSI